MKLLKELKWDALLLGFLYILLGIVALVLPETMEKFLGYLIAVVLILAGAVSMIAYLLRDARQNYYHNDFLYGLIGIVAGILMLYNVELIIMWISFLLGVLVLVSGCSKLQDVIDMKRLECGNWIAMLAGAAVNVALGIVLMCKPFESAALMGRLLGVGLILSGISDCAVMIYFARRIKKYVEDLQAVDHTFTEKTEVEETKAAKKADGTAESKQSVDRRRAEEQRQAGEQRQTGEQHKPGEQRQAGGQNQTEGQRQTGEPVPDGEKDQTEKRKQEEERQPEKSGQEGVGQ